MTRFAVGDEVYGVLRGSYAEYAAAHDRNRRPPGRRAGSGQGHRRLRPDTEGTALSPFVSQRLTMVTANENSRDLQRLAALVESGR